MPVSASFEKNAPVKPHARISPSALKATELCPARVRVNIKAKREATIFSAEGTFLHSIMEDCIEQDFEPQEYIGHTRKVDGFEIEFTPEMADCMIDALDWVREQPGKIFVETQVFLDPWMPGQWGFLDLAILHVTATRVILTIVDWKFGVGMVVPIIGNYQLRAYALAFIETVLKPMGIIPDEINLIIEQPRAYGRAPRYYEPWTLTYEELLPFGDTMRAIMRAAEDPNAPRIAGPAQCDNCAAGFPGGCATFDAYHLDLIGIIFPPFDPEANDLLTDEMRAALVRNKSQIEGWLKAIHAQSLAAAIDGNPPPGLKAIDGDQGDRDWLDAEKAKAMMLPVLRDKSFTQKLISPPQLEKIAKPTRTKPGLPDLWTKLQEEIFRKPSKPQLVLASDPRPAIQPVEDMFDDLD